MAILNFSLFVTEWEIRGQHKTTEWYNVSSLAACHGSSGEFLEYPNLSPESTDSNLHGLMGTLKLSKLPPFVILKTRTVDHSSLTVGGLKNIQ